MSDIFYLLSVSAACDSAAVLRMLHSLSNSDLQRTFIKLQPMSVMENTLLLLQTHYLRHP